jgi:methylmalonyl-CoA/ethylmalonyl-CoA epimerase
VGEAFSGIGRIGQVRIAVSDVDRAVAFYRDVLGMPFLFQFPGMAFFELGDTRLMLVDPESRDFGGQSVIYYEVPDINAAHEWLAARGVQFDDRPHVVHKDDAHEEWMCFFRDPDDNVLALMSKVPLA